MTIRTFTAIAAALLATSASAADFSFTGNFALDNSKAAYSFTLASAATVTLTSLGYAGGTNAAGQTITRGGFDPVLSLYDASGSAVDFNDDGAGAPLDSVTGVGGDSLLSLALGAGSYTVYLTQYSNFGPQTLPGFFAFDGQPSFRGGFVDFYGDQRNGSWALDLSGVDSVATAAVPEPAAWALMIAGFMIVGTAARRRNTALAA